MQHIVHQPRSAFYESGCLGMQPKMGGKFASLDWNIQKLLSYLSWSYLSKTVIMLELSALQFACCKVCAKNKNLLICNEKCKICVFWGSNLNILLSCLKLASLNCLIAKFHQIMKMPKFQTTNTLFRHFWARTLKNICHI